MKLVFDTTKENLKPIVRGMLKEGLHNFVTGKDVVDLDSKFFTNMGIDTSKAFEVLDDTAGHNNLYMTVQEALNFERERLIDLCNSVDVTQKDDAKDFSKVLELTTRAFRSLNNMIERGESDKIIVLHLDTDMFRHFTDFDTVNFAYVQNHLL